LGINAKQQSRIPQHQNELQMCRIGTTLATNPAASRSDDKMGCYSMPKIFRQVFRSAAASELLVVGADNFLRDREKCCTLEGTMSRRSANIPKTQSRRVAAWIYAVINPVVDSLGHEQKLLNTENLTWRSNLGRCESIHSIQEYVEVAQWPNFQDFQTEHDIFLKTFGQHDADLKSVNDRAQHVFDWLTSRPEFSRAIAELIEGNETANPSTNQPLPVNNSRPEVLKAAAENVINNIPTLPAHYLFAPFWNLAAFYLLPFRNLPEFVSLHDARAKLLEISSGLKQGLEDQRLSFSRKFDIPAAPIPGLSLEV
jgi:hypothetical protein